MRRVFSGGSRFRFPKYMWIVVVIYFLVGDYDSLFSKYSSRQVADRVPYGHHTRFWVYTPRGPADREEGYPLLLSLHGGSAIGDNLNMLFEKTHENPAQLIHINKWFDLPFIVVSPQLRRDPKVPHYNEQVWSPELVDEVVEYVRERYPIDAARIYVTGISSGAKGAWDYAMAYPDKVAALLPMGGQAPMTGHCVLKDIPVWAFHGENDVFVRTRFTTDAVKAISECSPPGAYRPQVNVCKSMEHEVWDQIFNRKGGYDVLQWLLAFRKGDTSNKAPFVFAGLDRKMKVSSEPFYLAAEYFDSDGSIAKAEWTSRPESTPGITLEPDGKFVRVKGATRPGEYTFRLTVTDDQGASRYDDATITLLEDDKTPAIERLVLTNQTGTTHYGYLANDQVYDLGEIGNRINVMAETEAFNVTMRWSVNSDQSSREVNQFHLRFWKDYAPFYIRETQAGAVKSGWTVTPGDYLICATAFRNGIWLDGEGTSVCYKITFTDGTQVSGPASQSPSVIAFVPVAPVE